MRYPYLGITKTDDEKSVVVFFTERDKGVVVSNETEDERYKFGKYDEYDEDIFVYFPQNQCVRLNN